MESSNRPLLIFAFAVAAILLLAIGGWMYGRGSAAPAPLPEAAPVAVRQPTPAPPPPPETRSALPDLAGQILDDGCRQGECHWSRVVRLESVSTSPQGELRRLTARRGVSTYDPMGDPPEAYGEGLDVRWDPADRSDYIFCSRQRPAFAFPDDDGSLIIHYLDFYDLGGYQLNSAQTYMRVCHGLQFNAQDSAQLRQLGYRPDTRNEQVEHGRPEDLTRF